MDEELTRLAFRVQGGDRDAARALLALARAGQHAAAFDRAAKALEGGPEVLTIVEASVDPAARASFRELVPSPAEAASSFTPAPIELGGLDALGPDALVSCARWAIEALHALPRFGTGLPFLGAAIAAPWLHVSRVFAGRVEAPWIAMRVVASLDPSKKALADAVVRGFFVAHGERASAAVLTVLAHEAPPVRRLLWTKLLLEHPDRVDDASLAALLDDPPTRDLAMNVLLRRGAAAAKHALPFLHATAPGTRRAVAGLLAVLGDADAVPFLRQALARERDPRTRVQLAAALEKISGAEPLVPMARGEDAVVARARAALASPRQPKPPPWLAGLPDGELPPLRWREGETDASALSRVETDASALSRVETDASALSRVETDASALSRVETDALLGRLALLRASHVDAAIADVRAALEPASARALVAAIRAAFVTSRERHVFPEWVLRAAAMLLPEADVDALCEEIDENLRTPARERWRRGPAASVELVWDPDAIASSPCRVAFAWLVHWAESGPKRRDREKAQRALLSATRAVPESERPFACIRRFGLDDDGARRFEEAGSVLVVRVRPGGAIEVTSGDGARVLRLPNDPLGKRVKRHVAAVEEALLEARRTLAEAYADRLVVDVRFVRGFLLSHPLWRPIAQGCVVRRESAPETLRVGDEALGALPEDERLRFVLAQVEG